jgi:hypothetical protein
MDFGNPWQGTKVTTLVRKREATGVFSALAPFRGRAGTLRKVETEVWTAEQPVPAQQI